MKLREYNSTSFYNQWTTAMSVLTLCAGAISLWQKETLFLVLTNLATFGLYLAKAKSYLKNYPLKLGYGNWLTVARLVIVLLCGFFLNEWPTSLLFVLLFFAILLDGLDGFLARRYKHTSEYGARLDMETDAFLVWLLGVHHVSNGALPTWIIVPAAMRYIFGLLSLLLAPAKELTSHRFRASIAVVFFLSLLSPFILKEAWYTPVVNVSGGLILCSFGLSLLARLLRTDSLI